MGGIQLKKTTLSFKLSLINNSHIPRNLQIILQVSHITEFDPDDLDSTSF